MRSTPDRPSPRPRRRSILSRKAARNTAWTACSGCMMPLPSEWINSLTRRFWNTALRKTARRARTTSRRTFSCTSKRFSRTSIWQELSGLPKSSWNRRAWWAYLRLGIRAPVRSRSRWLRQSLPDFIIYTFREHHLDLILMQAKSVLDGVAAGNDGISLPLTAQDVAGDPFAQTVGLVNQ